MRLLVVAGIAVGVALRIWALASPSGGLDADEAVWGLMARHVLDGELPTFFWAQAYGGTLETFPTAAVFAVAGAGTVALRIVPLALFAVAAVLVWRAGLRTVGEPAARIAAVAFWIWPSYLVWKSTRAHGFYGAATVLALVILVLALRLRERDSRLDLAALGVAVGAGWWATPQIAFVAAPAVAWLAWRRLALLRDGWAVAAGALAGASAWIAWNLGHGWESLQTPFERGDDTYFDHLRTFFYATLPTSLGLRAPFSLDWLVGELPGRALEALALVSVVALVFRRGRRRELLLAVAVTYPFLQAVSPFSSLNEEPRYLVLLMPISALLLSEALARRAVVAALGLAALAALSAAGLENMQAARLPVPPVAGERVPEDLGPVLDTLRQAGATRALAHYSIAYRITFESREDIVATPDGGTTRYPPHRRLVLASRSPAYVFVAGSVAERAKAPELAGSGYRRVDVGDWIVYLPRRT